MKQSLLVAMLFLSSASVTAAEPKMNVLFIVSDDLTNNTLHCYGSPRGISPYIDELAAKGVRFDRAYCQFPLCNPSRASFLTGLRPDQCQIYENATQLRKTVPNTKTLPQAFQDAGYTVARVGKLYHYGVPAQIGTDGLDDAASWQKTVNPSGRDKDEEESIFSLNPNGKGSGRFGGTLSWLATGGEAHEQTDGKVAIATAKLLEEYQAKPFFLACGFFRPHTPYVAPKSFFEKFPLNSMTLATVPVGHRAAGPAPAFGSSKKEQDAMTDDLRRRALQAYHASTTLMDSQVGVVLGALKKLNLEKSTIVVFISDHGYHLGEHGLWQKMSLFENSARVPMVIYDPRTPNSGAVCKRTVELIDLYPTLCDLCGLPTPAYLTGKSLKPFLSDANAKWEKPALTQVSRGAIPIRGGPAPKGKAGIMGYSLRTERYRYTEWDGGKKGVQLYDLEVDPGELKNLADDPANAKLIAELHAKIAALKVVKP